MIATEHFSMLGTVIGESENVICAKLDKNCLVIKSRSVIARNI